MIHALAFAMLAGHNAATQTVKTIEIDRFNTMPYSVTIVNKGFDSHGWIDLTLSQSLFPLRNTYVDILQNFGGGTLTFAIGNHSQMISTTASMTWSLSLQNSTDGIRSVDLSAVDRFLVDLTHVPDIAQLYIGDVHGNSGAGGWYIRAGGIYFRPSDFNPNLDWRHVVYVKLRQDFDAFTNPANYAATRFYATLKPQSLPPNP